MLIREQDRDEILAAGEDVEATIEAAIRLSTVEVWVFSINGDLAGVWGVIPCDLLGGWAVPWVLTTATVDRHKKTFFAESRRVMTRLRKRFGKMTNMIDVRYAASVNWARRLGFSVSDPVQYPGTGMKFYKISMEA
jgi:hypothetical protein